MCLTLAPLSNFTAFRDSPESLLPCVLPIRAVTALDSNSYPVSYVLTVTGCSRRKDIIANYPTFCNALTCRLNSAIPA